MASRINILFSKIPAWMCRHRFYILGFYAFFLILSTIGAEKEWRDDSLKSWFGKDSEIFKNLNRFENQFGGNEDVYIVYEAKDGDIFSQPSLEALSKLHAALARFPLEIQKNPDTPLNHTREILSLINIQVTEVDGNDLSMHPFIGDKLPDDDNKRNLLKLQALNDPDLILNFISKDARYGGIVIKTSFGLEEREKNEVNVSDDAVLDFSVDVFEHSDDEKLNINKDTKPKDYEAYADFMSAIRGQVEEAGVNQHLNIYYAGLPEIISFQVNVMGSEMLIIFLGLFILMFVLLLLLFRHLSVVTWSFVIILLTINGTLGLIGWTGIPTSSLTDAMILMLILISAADAIHIFSGYRYERIQGYDHSESLSRVYGKAGVSCFLTSFTTIVGFSSLWLAKPSVPVANFGLFAAFGIVLAFILTITLLPVLINFWPQKINPHTQVKETEAPDHVNFMRFVYRLASFSPVTVTILFMVTVLICGAGISKLKIDTNTLESFDKSSYIRKAFEIADKEMGGTQNIDFMIELETVDAVYDPKVLRAIDQLQQRMLAGFPDLVVTGSSIVNILKRINKQFHEDNPSYYRLPESDGEIRQLLFLFNNVSPEERRRLISDDFDATRISFNVRNAGSTAYVSLVEKAKAWGDEFFLPLKSSYPEIKVTNAGGLTSFMYLFDRIASSQVISFCITLMVISITLIIILGSLKLGLLALIPNLVPVLITFGVMGWFGISLDPTNMIMAPIILGIAVDDTIHFLNKYKLILPQCANKAIAVREALYEAGSAICFTSLILIGGLLTMLYSSDSSFQSFGYLSALALGSALLSDILLVPALLLISEKRHAENPGKLVFEKTF